MNLTKQGRIARKVVSHVRPEVFFRSEIDDEDEEVSDVSEHVMMMETSPGTALVMVKA